MEPERGVTGKRAAIIKRILGSVEGGASVFIFFPGWKKRNRGEGRGKKAGRGGKCVAIGITVQVRVFYTMETENPMVRRKRKKALGTEKKRTLWEKRKGTRHWTQKYA